MSREQGKSNSSQDEEFGPFVSALPQPPPSSSEEFGPFVSAPTPARHSPVYIYSAPSCPTRTPATRTGKLIDVSQSSAPRRSPPQKAAKTATLQRSTLNDLHSLSPSPFCTKQEAKCAPSSSRPAKSYAPCPKPTQTGTLISLSPSPFSSLPHQPAFQQLTLASTSTSTVQSSTLTDLQGPTTTWACREADTAMNEHADAMAEAAWEKRDRLREEERLRELAGEFWAMKDDEELKDGGKMWLDLSDRDVWGE